jgi:hypothetical protein
VKRSGRHANGSSRKKKREANASDGEGLNAHSYGPTRYRKTTIWPTTRDPDQIHVT